MAKKSIFSLTVMFMVTIFFSFAASDVKAESVEMTTLDSGSQSHAMAGFVTLLADDESDTEDIFDEESDYEEEIVEEPEEEIEEVDEGDDEEMEEEIEDEAPDNDDSEEGWE